MRILWAGIGPGHATGYGLMTREFTRRFRDAGHEVVLALFGEPVLDPLGRPNRNGTLNHPDHVSIRDGGTWEGMRALGPASQWKRDKDGKWQAAGEFRLPGQSFIWDAFGGHNPDLVIVLKDAWVLDPEDYREYNTAVWLVFDTEPMGAPDRSFFARCDARAVCASTAGQRMAASAGLADPLYVPHGIDTGIWTPGPREAARELLGLPEDVFIAGIDAANIGPRKAWGEQFAAFADFHSQHPGSLLLVHAAPEHPEGISLRDLRSFLHLDDAVKFGAHTAMDDAQMVNWMRSLDVLMAASYGEGFGLPIVQAQACGIPVIGTDCSAITEKIPKGTGWLVPGQPWWNPHHQAWWHIPSVEGITRALHRAAGLGHDRRDLIRAHAMGYDADHVMKEHWTPVLEELCGG